ncbi:MAG: hypothetical protein U1C96_13505 [Gallionella sp.]|nr:hypothetical protein [Gallionella sp.]
MHAAAAIIQGVSVNHRAENLPCDLGAPAATGRPEKTENVYSPAMSQSYAFEIAVAAGNFPRLIDALGEHPDVLSVCNREETAVFLLPEIVWAEVDIKLPESPE